LVRLFSKSRKEKAAFFVKKAASKKLF